MSSRRAVHILPRILTLQNQFMYLTVPIPQKKTFSRIVYVVPMNPQAQRLRVSCIQTWTWNCRLIRTSRSRSNTPPVRHSCSSSERSARFWTFLLKTYVKCEILLQSLSPLKLLLHSCLPLTNSNRISTNSGWTITAWLMLEKTISSSCTSYQRQSFKAREASMRI